MPGLTDAGAAEIVLRAARAADLAPLTDIRADRQAQHLLLAHPADKVTAEDVQAWIARREAEPGGLFRVIADGASERALGFVQIAGVHRLDRHGLGGICLSAAARGHGVGRAAMRLLLDAARDECGLRKMLLYVRADNAPALRLYAGLTFREAGVLRSHYHDGAAWHDVIVLERMIEGAA